MGRFTDGYVDELIQQASHYDADPVIRALARAIRNRRPPKLLKEVLVLKQEGDAVHEGHLFHQNCRHRLSAITETHAIPLGRFLVCDTPALTLEKRGALLTEVQARMLEPEEKEELIKIFVESEVEPVSVVSVPHSILRVCASHFYQAFRLYFVADDSDNEGLVSELRQSVANWHRPG